MYLTEPKLCLSSLLSARSENKRSENVCRRLDIPSIVTVRAAGSGLCISLASTDDAGRTVVVASAISALESLLGEIVQTVVRAVKRKSPFDYILSEDHVTAIC